MELKSSDTIGGNRLIKVHTLGYWLTLLLVVTHSVYLHWRVVTLENQQQQLSLRRSSGGGGSHDDTQGILIGSLLPRYRRDVDNDNGVNNDLNNVVVNGNNGGGGGVGGDNNNLCGCPAGE